MYYYISIIVVMFRYYTINRYISQVQSNYIVEVRYYSIPVILNDILE